VVEQYPRSTVGNGVLLPSTRAAIELSRGRPAAALEELRAAAAYETGTVAALIPAYLRADAYLRQGAGPRALETFLGILEHRGTDPFSPVCAVARLGVARAWRLAGNREKSAQAYRDFLAFWAQADPDVPIVREARAEHDRLTARRPAR
jgi:hypothetical protein